MLKIYSINIVDDGDMGKDLLKISPQWPLLMRSLC
jgi:hypothetical protein